ncbi:hypothetical protein DBV15_01673 [Temnothorax longispinosus]|uniref:Uncharacterized protein n=1 Tax=Temnothorax longispinosus TaxID=300112 RepID=A0A4S2L0X2_9HYME|nr:hypothetical protein DBV15_01673 [Temnothorax longispinosus]
MSSASLSSSPPWSPSRFARGGGTGDNDPGDHLAGADRETGSRLERTRREESLQLGIPSFSFRRRQRTPSRFLVARAILSPRARLESVEEIVTRGTTMKIRIQDKRHGKRPGRGTEQRCARRLGHAREKTLRITKLVNESATVKKFLNGYILTTIPAYLNVRAVLLPLPPSCRVTQDRGSRSSSTVD